MKIRINTKKIEMLRPCKNLLDNWKEHYQDFNGDIIEFLDLPNITESDKIWVSVRLIPKNILEIFAIDCAFSAADYAASYSAYTPATAADAASAAINAANAIAYVAGAADYDATGADIDAADAVAYARDYTNAASWDAAYAAYATDNSSDAAIDSERIQQIEALIYLIQEEK